MPGLVGLVRRDGAPVEDEAVVAMTASHSGHADATQYLWSEDRSVALALLPGGLKCPHVLLTSRRPPGLRLYCLGEVFNEEFPSGRRGHALLDAWLKEGPRLLNRLNGSFILAALEPAAARLTLAGDLTASLPLYLLQHGEYLAFSTELRPLLFTPGYSPHVNPAGLAGFLSNGYILEGETLLEGVRVLGPGQWLTADRGRIERRTYWACEFAEPRDGREEKALSEEMGRLLLKAVERRTSPDASYTILLSGGYDSRAILGLVRLLHPDIPITTVTWGEDNGRPDSDVARSRDIARLAGTSHRFYPLDPTALPEHFREYVLLSEGRTDAVGNYPAGLEVFHAIRAETQTGMILRGDHCFGLKKFEHSDVELLHSLNIHSFLRLPFSYRYLRPGLRLQLARVGQEQIGRILRNCPYPGLHDRKDYLYYHQRLANYLQPLSHLKLRAIGLRSPFTDAELVYFMHRLPSPMRLRKALFRRTLRDLLPDYQWADMARSNNLIDWERQLRVNPALRGFIRRVLLEERNGFSELLDPKRLARFLEKAFQARPASRRSVLRKVQKKARYFVYHYSLELSAEIFRLMIVKVWADEFLGGNFDLAEPAGKKPGEIPRAEEDLVTLTEAV
ncbi:MAG: hypothetical protein C4524_10195 [Candidatus Zixiibacteriota bacterium]|nr:MAG: hypothetical protein C4524_10195 [candidate division Zixibacteria bacterium]